MVITSSNTNACGCHLGDKAFRDLVDFGNGVDMFVII